MIRINPFFLCQRSYYFRRNWSSISFPFPFKSSYVFLRSFETPKNGQIPFFRNTYKIRHYKKDNVIEIHVLPRQICNLLSSCLAGKD
ncbi:hypothetical protein RJ639_037360 [Escallonia herrerae]|uniref:Uncharacterized protein n=1 Tax=Escallonia herrerae TaxID=1293975 RepID=A0AA89BI28_9ASTE|nr:hypothetical protein RJ639_037360 [Escallonia herrerae]